jgi:16S rRNA G966 N2-methylase RsmD
VTSQWVGPTLWIERCRTGYPPPVETNALYYGDRLSILRDFIPDESVDLIYLDPPFNSNRDYNVQTDSSRSKNER